MIYDTNFDGILRFLVLRNGSKSRFSDSFKNLLKSFLYKCDNSFVCSYCVD